MSTSVDPRDEANDSRAHDEPRATGQASEAGAGLGQDVDAGEPTVDPADAVQPSAREVVLQARIERLEAELRQKEARFDEVYRAYRHADDEFKRMRERMERELRRDLEQEKHRAIAMFFEVADNLERSLDAANRDGSRESLVDGLKLVQHQFQSTLERLGVTPVSPQGERFDPELHEAMGVMPVPNAAQHQTVVGVLRTGYRVGDHVLRAPLVMVGQHQAG